MTQMADPTDALKMFQDAMYAGHVELEWGRVSPNVYMHPHRGARVPQYTYVLIEGKTVLAFATFALNRTYNGAPSLAVGYAVSEGRRSKGLAQTILRAGIAELQNGFKGMPPFYVEAVVSETNTASTKVAEAVLGGEIERITDGHSGEPTVRYTHLFETSPSYTR